MRPPSSPEGRQFFMSPDTEFARLCAGGNRIRTIGPAEKEMAVERGPAADIVVSRDHLCLMTPSSLSVRHLSSATAERPFTRAGPMVRIRFPPAVSQRTSVLRLPLTRFSADPEVGA